MHYYFKKSQLQDTNQRKYGHIKNIQGRVYNKTVNFIIPGARVPELSCDHIIHIVKMHLFFSCRIMTTKEGSTKIVNTAAPVLRLGYLSYIVKNA